MEREGPGFLADLAFLLLTFFLCIAVAGAIDGQVGGSVGLLLAIGTVVVIAFCSLWLYYRIFLDERPILGTASRSRFAILLVQIVLVGFVISALFAPPDPATQVIVAFIVITIGTTLAYWWVYRRNTPEVAQAGS